MVRLDLTDREASWLYERLQDSDVLPLRGKAKRVFEKLEKAREDRDEARNA